MLGLKADIDRSEIRLRKLFTVQSSRVAVCAASCIVGLNSLSCSRMWFHSETRLLSRSSVGFSSCHTDRTWASFQALHR